MAELLPVPVSVEEAEAALVAELEVVLVGVAKDENELDAVSVAVDVKDAVGVMSWLGLPLLVALSEMDEVIAPEALMDAVGVLV